MPTPPPKARGHGQERRRRGSARLSRGSRRRPRTRTGKCPRPRREVRARAHSSGGYSAHMADFRPVEANKGHILMIRPAPDGTPIEDANVEWVEIIADLSS